jgi:hypothetical protein
MRRTALLGIFIAALVGLSAGSFVPGRLGDRVLGQEATGSVAGWVFWGYCQPYGYGVSSGSAPEGETTTVPAPDRPVGPVIVYPEPLPIPAVGALVALQGTDLAARTDEEGFFLIEGVPVGVYYSVAASFPRRPSPAAMAESGRPAAPVPAPLVCAPAVSLRGNVIVQDSTRPTNVGALILPRRFGPRPLAPGQAAPEEAPEDDVEP